MRINADHAEVKRLSEEICKLRGTAAFTKRCMEFMKSNLFYRGNPQFENWRTSDDFLAYIVGKSGICPALDLCCDELGINARAPLYYSARTNALRQLQYIAGKELICNPPFQLMLAFGKLLDDAYLRDAGTRAIFVIPYRKRCKHFYAHLMQRSHWRLVCHFATGSPVFVGVSKSGDVFQKNECRAIASREPILVFSVKRENADDQEPRISIDELSIVNRDTLLLVGQLKAQIRELQAVPQPAAHPAQRARNIDYKSSGLPGVADEKAPDAFCARCFRLFAADKEADSAAKKMEEH